MTAISVKDLRVARDGTDVLHGVSFDVPAGSVYALLGGNGAGKSTTLLTLLGFLEPGSGQATVLGSDVAAEIKHVREQVAYLPEAATLYPHLDAYENLSYFLDLAGRTIDTAALDGALDAVDLQTDARIRPMSGYSKGMRQKVAIALALLRETPVLLLDEPTSGLDPVAIDEFNTLIRQLATDGKTVLMVTHDVYGACQVADRIGLLRRGELVGTFETDGEHRIDTEAVHAAFAGESRSMSRVITIARDEWRQWRRSRLAVAGLTVFAALLIIVSILTAFDVSEARHERQHQQAEAQTTFLDQPDRHPHRMVHYGHYVFRAPAPLALFDPGVDSVTGQSIFLEGHRQNSAMFADARAEGPYRRVRDADAGQTLSPVPSAPAHRAGPCGHRARAGGPNAWPAALPRCERTDPADGQGARTGGSDRIAVAPRFNRRACRRGDGVKALSPR